MNNIKLSRPQISVQKARTPLVLDMAGQGGGKTMNIGVSTFGFIRSCPQAKGFIGANTHEQLTKSTLVRAFGIWKMLGDWTQYDAKSNPSGVYVVNKKPPSHFVQFETLDDYRKTISFQNGALIFTGSLKNYLAHDGKEFAWCHLDETKDTKKEAVTDVIIGRLRQRGLWYAKEVIGQPYYFNNEITNDEATEEGLVAINPLIVHTSPSSSGVEWLLDLFKLKPFEKEIREALADKYDYFERIHEDVTAVIYQTYWNENNLPSGHIEKEIRRMSSNEKLLFIDGFPFARNGSEYFPEFSRSKHVIPARFIPFDFNNTFLMSMDFNVVPYVTLISVQTKYVVKFLNEQTGQKKDFIQEGDEGFVPIEVMQMFVQKEFLKRNPDNETDKACFAFCEWLELNEANCDVFGYGDATGNARIVGLGSLTNWKIAERAVSEHFYFEKKVKKTNPSNRLRRSFMNRLFKGSYPELEIYISDECVETIRDFEFLKQSVDGGKFKEKEKDKATGESYEKIGHCFVGETMIETIEGKKRIDEIKVGELVLTRQGFKKVLNVFNNGIRDVRKYSINGKIIECTEDHKIFTFNRGFVAIKEINNEDRLCDLSYSTMKHGIIKLNFDKRNVFDIEVEDVHEYFANDVLVHNCSDTVEYVICELCIDYLKDIN